jgi:hypothetical protein
MEYLQLEGLKALYEKQVAMEASIMDAFADIVKKEPEGDSYDRGGYILMDNASSGKDLKILLKDAGIIVEGRK